MFTEFGEGHPQRTNSLARNGPIIMEKPELIHGFGFRKLRQRHYPIPIHLLNIHVDRHVNVVPRRESRHEVRMLAELLTRPAEILPVARHPGKLYDRNAGQRQLVQRIVTDEPFDQSSELNKWDYGLLIGATFITQRRINFGATLTMGLRSIYRNNYKYIDGVVRNVYLQTFVQFSLAKNNQ